MSAPTAWTVAGVRAALQAKKVSARELAAEFYGRIDRRNAELNAFLTLSPERAYAQADCIDAAVARGETLPPLAGVPVAIKDVISTRGIRTTCASKILESYVPPYDATAVERLDRAGAVFLGKTNCDEFAMGGSNENSAYGPVRNPVAPDRVPGGSSGGSAAAVAAGLAVAALGTDTGGSIRVPAALCGLAGYRATIGRGNWRGGAHLSVTFDTLGWLFRDLEDAPLLAAPYASVQNQKEIRFTRFAFLSDKFLHDCEPEVIEGFRRVIGELRALGLDAEPIDPEWWNDSIDIFAPLQASEAALLHAGNFDRFEPSIRDRLKWGAGHTSGEVAALRQRHTDFRARMDEIFAAHQLVLLPCAPVARLAARADHSQTRSRLLRYTSPFSLAGVPAIAIPCARGGMQLAAARDFDEPLLALAARIGARRNAASES